MAGQGTANDFFGKLRDLDQLVDVERLIEVAKLAEEIVGRPLPGHVMRGGTLKAAKQRAAQKAAA